jgi:hypothetical protein
VPGRKRPHDFDTVLEAQHAPQGLAGAALKPSVPEAEAGVKPHGAGAKAPSRTGPSLPGPAPGAHRALGNAGAAPSERAPPAGPAPQSEAVASFASTASAAFAQTQATTWGASPGPGHRGDGASGAVPTPPPADAAHTLLQLALTDTSLTVDVRQQVVSLALDTEAAGALELELRLEVGRAHVFVDGPGAPLLAQHAPALRAVLAEEGLALGDFSTSTSTSHREEPPERSEPKPPPVPPAPEGVTPPSRRHRHEGRIDIEA